MSRLQIDAIIDVGVLKNKKNGRFIEHDSVNRNSRKTLQSLLMMKIQSVKGKLASHNRRPLKHCCAVYQTLMGKDWTCPLNEHGIREVYTLEKILRFLCIFRYQSSIREGNYGILSRDTFFPEAAVF